MTSPGSGVAQVIVVPREIVNADSVYLVAWSLPDGTRVDAGAAVCEIETSKAIETLESAEAGYLRHRAGVGEEVPVGGVLGYVTEAANTPLPETAPANTATAPDQGTRFSARARRKVEELGIDPRLFAGRGSVREQDVLAMASRQTAEIPAAADPRGPSRREPLGTIQRRVARVMEQSVAAVPTACLERLVDLAPVGARARELAGASQAVVTEVDLLVAAVAYACVRFPRFNSFLAGDDLCVFEQVNVGVAVDVEGDLYVVTVRDAARKRPVEIAKELRALQYRALRRRLDLEHMSGGTITVTSMIGRGVHRFQPIPYPQQAAIIGIADSEPGTTRATLTLVFDHRVANGTEAAAFLAAIHDSLVGN